MYTDIHTGDSFHSMTFLTRKTFMINSRGSISNVCVDLPLFSPSAFGEYDYSTLKYSKRYETKNV